MFVLDVSGIGCGSCITKITKAIQALDNEAKVLVDRAAGPARSTLKVAKTLSESAQLRKRWVSLSKSAPEGADPLQR